MSKLSLIGTLSLGLLAPSPPGLRTSRRRRRAAAARRRGHRPGSAAPTPAPSGWWPARGTSRSTARSRPRRRRRPPLPGRQREGPHPGVQGHLHPPVPDRPALQGRHRQAVRRGQRRRPGHRQVLQREAGSALAQVPVRPEPGLQRARQGRSQGRGRRRSPKRRPRRRRPPRSPSPPRRDVGPARADPAASRTPALPCPFALARGSGSAEPAASRKSALPCPFALARGSGRGRGEGRRLGPWAAPLTRRADAPTSPRNRGEVIGVRSDQIRGGGYRPAYTPQDSRTRRRELRTICSWARSLDSSVMRAMRASAPRWPMRKPGWAMVVRRGRKPSCHS